MEVFDSLEQHIQNPVVLQSILSLMDRGTMVLTTNYDNLLEIFGQQQSKPMESLDLKDKTKVWAGWAGVREVIAVDMLLASALKQDSGVLLDATLPFPPAAWESCPSPLWCLLLSTCTPFSWPVLCPAPFLIYISLLAVTVGIWW